MTTPWFRTQPQLLNAVKEAVRAKYPDLIVCDERETVFIRGSLAIVHDGETLDRYQVEIEFPPDYPRALPMVRETGGRIPRVINRHVYPGSGNACLVVDEEWLLSAGGTISFVEFMEGPVRNFFLGQSLVEAGRRWPFGERSHGGKGLVETYGEWFGTQEEGVVLTYLRYLSGKKVKGHWACPCGGGRSLRDCHLDQFHGFQKRIPRWLAKQALERLTRARNAETKPRL